MLCSKGEHPMHKLQTIIHRACACSIFHLFRYNYQGNESVAHSDQPLKEGNVHISAPHIYASILGALDLEPNSSTSFLNVGSGTGYFSCIVASILGPNSLNYGAYLHSYAPEGCRSILTQLSSNYNYRRRASRRCYSTLQGVHRKMEEHHSGRKTRSLYHSFHG